MKGYQHYTDVHGDILFIYFYTMPAVVTANQSGKMTSFDKVILIKLREKNPIDFALLNFLRGLMEHATITLRALCHLMFSCSMRRSVLMIYIKTSTPICIALLCQRVSCESQSY